MGLKSMRHSSIRSIKGSVAFSRLSMPPLTTHQPFANTVASKINPKVTQCLIHHFYMKIYIMLHHHFI